MIVNEVRDLFQRFIQIYSFVFSRTKKCIQVWDNLRVSKWGQNQNFHFWVNYPFKSDHQLIFPNEEIILCSPLYLTLGNTQIAVFILFYFIFDWQEVLLKRAADLIETFCGMPHNNQVNSIFAINIYIFFFLLWLTAQDNFD